MARYKTSQKLTIRIPFEDLEMLREKFGRKLASHLRDLIKSDLQPEFPKTALGYCNNLHCPYGCTPERIPLKFDAKNHTWQCSHCQEFTIDVDEKTIKGEKDGK